MGSVIKSPDHYYFGQKRFGMRNHQHQKKKKQNKPSAEQEPCSADGRAVNDSCNTCILQLLFAISHTCNICQENKFIKITLI